MASIPGHGGAAPLLRVPCATPALSDQILFTTDKPWFPDIPGLRRRPANLRLAPRPTQPMVPDMLMIFLAVVVLETHLKAMVHYRNRPQMVVVKFCTMLCGLSDDHEPDDRAVHRAAQGWLVAKHLSVAAAAAIILLTARITMWVLTISTIALGGAIFFLDVHSEALLAHGRVGVMPV